MLVKCIKADTWNLLACGFPVEGPGKGEICRVLREDAHGFYQLKGYDHAVYRKTRFVPHDGTDRGMKVFKKMLRPVKEDA